MAVVPRADAASTATALIGTKNAVNASAQVVKVRANFVRMLFLSSRSYFWYAPPGG
jgi:hypothetical protein